MEHKEVVQELSALIDLNKDSEDAYRHIADAAVTDELTTTFHIYARDRAQMVADLEQEVLRLGEEPWVDGTFVAALQREWYTLRDALKGNDPAAKRELAIDEAMRREQQAKERYEAALKKGLPQNVRDVVQKQFDDTRKALSDIQALKQQTA